MGWAEWFARGRERAARARRLSRIMQLVMFGGLLAGAAGWSMYSDTVHQLNGKPSSATLLEHIKECTVEYQRVGEDKRKDPMDCDAAEAFQKLVGPNKVKIGKDYFARVRFSLAGGQTHEAKVEESRLGSFTLPVGASIAVVYAPDHPGDVRAVLTWDRLQAALLLFAGGLVLLLLAFAGRIAALYRGRAGIAARPQMR
jgi:hypothetical protein